MEVGDPKKWTLGLGSGGAGGLTLGAIVSNPAVRSYLVAFGVVCLLAAVALLTALFLKRRNARQSETAIKNEVAQNAVQRPSRVLTEQQKQDLADLDIKLSEGIDTLRETKVKVSDIPWYLVMGEPASGKTFACHALFNQIPRPEGVNNALQGKGGTFNMDWWFYEDAVLLDTAGRIVFESTPEWKGLLKRLNKLRPDCPINGVILVIPADSLLNDGEDKIREKAKRLREQLVELKKDLDLRFPVYILVTKSDMIPGFREFVDQLSTDESRNQIFGWSYPEKNLDIPFEPAQTHSALDEVIASVQQQCLSAVWQLPTSFGLCRRINEVDDLFNFPNALREREANLALYLNEIFGNERAAGESASRYKTRGSKQLFWRGIYFISTVQQGPVYDPVTARKFGLKPEQLSRGKARAQQRVYFLRDLVTKKIFPEQGLVTAVDNIQRTRRIRAAILMGVASVALLVLVGLIAMGQSKLRNSVGGDVAYWNEAINPQPGSGQSDRDWLLSPTFNLPSDGRVNRLEFHRHLADRVQKSLPDVPWLFRIAQFAIEPMRKEAQWCVFSNDFLVPFITKVQGRMAGIPGEEQPDGGKSGLATSEEADRLKAVLLSMVHFETDLKNRSGNVENAVSLLTNGVQFIAGTNSFPDTNFIATFRGTLSVNPPTLWPLSNLSRGSIYESNLPVSRAAARLLKFAGDQYKTQKEAFEALEILRSLLDKFLREEQALDTRIREGDVNRATIEPLVTNLVGLASQIDDSRRKMVPISSLATAYQVLIDQGGTALSNEFAALLNALPSNCPPTLCGPLRDSLSGVQSPLISDVKRVVNEPRSTMVLLDQELLQVNGDRRHYQTRARTYQSALELGQRQIFYVGNRWAECLKFHGELDTSTNLIKSYRGGSPDATVRFDRISFGILKLAQGKHERFSEEYLHPAGNHIAEYQRLLEITPKNSESWVTDFVAAHRNLESLHDDLVMFFPVPVKSDVDRVWRSFTDGQRQELTRLYDNIKPRIERVRAPPFSHVWAWLSNYSSIGGTNPLTCRLTLLKGDGFENSYHSAVFAHDSKTDEVVLRTEIRAVEIRLEQRLRLGFKKSNTANPDWPRDAEFLPWELPRLLFQMKPKQPQDDMLIERAVAMTNSPPRTMRLKVEIKNR